MRRSRMVSTLYKQQDMGIHIKNAIEIENMSKQFAGFTLDKVSFNVPSGSIMGFVGENGAGKTTTIKAILDLIHPDDGSIRILGNSSKDLPRDIKAQIGVVFEGSNLHDNFTTDNINKIMMNIYPNWDQSVFFDYMNRFKLPKGKKIKDFSRGMKMKLSISVALSHNSKLLILDEATSGLDPMIREEILDIFMDFIQDEGHTILLSTHIISDIEKIADYVTFIHEGKIVFSENKDELIYRHGIIRCRKDDIQQIDRSYIVGIRENNYGAEVMIKDVDIFKRRYRELIPEKATIEEIMLFISRGKKV
jgi:ABC-2 type transport system ATP-binding protein